VLLTPLFATPGLIVLGALLITGGLAVAPAISVQFGLIGTLAPEGSVTEAFTWLLSASLAGSALGNAAGGAVAQVGGARLALLVPAALAAVGCGLSLTGGRRLLATLGPVTSHGAMPDRVPDEAIVPARDSGQGLMKVLP
jgi:MFS family permease